jgi:hypothetical protein
MPWSSGKTLCIAGWPTRKTATTKCFISVRPECWESFEIAIFPVFVTGRQACRLDAPGSRAMDPFTKVSLMRCAELCAKESSNLNLKWLF